MSNERREQVRQTVSAVTRIHPNDWSSTEATVVNLSRDGFRVACEAYLRPGNFFYVDLAGIGRVHAKVVWTSGSDVGARFIVPVDLRHCDWFDGGEVALEVRCSEPSTAAAEALALFRARFAKYGH